MAEQRLGVIMNGVTGRMGTNQHLARSVMAIRKEGGVRLADGTRVIPDPILVGRNAEKLKKLAAEHGVERWTTDLDEALRNPDDAVFFDAASTKLRPAVLKRAIAARKHIYCEKPVATSLAQALGLCRAAKQAGVRHGVVQDKLWLPGLLKIKALRARQPVRRSEERFLPRGAAHRGALGRKRRQVQGDRRRCRVRDFPARGRRRCAFQQFLVRARAPRRSGDIPG